MPETSILSFRTDIEHPPNALDIASSWPYRSDPEKTIIPQSEGKVNVTRFLFLFVVAAIIVISALPPVVAQEQMSRTDRESAKSMLRAVATDIKKNYYDPQFHGLDWDAIVSEAGRRVDKSQTFDVAMLHIAAIIDALNDSHTVFSPPRTFLNADIGHVRDWRSLVGIPNVRHDYGWEKEMVGARCFVSRVRPGSDAEKKGLHAGDEVLSINGYHPDRATIQRAEYVFNILRPQDHLNLEIISPTGVKSELVVAAKVQQVPLVSQYERSERAIQAYEDIEHISKPRTAEFGDELLIIKLPRFFLSPETAQGLIDKARKHKSLILDLRDNPGGTEDTLAELIGGVFDRQVKIGDKVMRSDRKPFTVKPLHNNFGGKIIVLIDSRSRSASEIFSRVVQIEKRGTVMGDRSAGSVMEAKFYPYQLSGTAVYYGVSITIADLVMTDGKSLEHVGVMPDEFIVPTASDIANGLDPVLAHAAETLGVTLSPEQAGKLFPYEWPKE